MAEEELAARLARRGFRMTPQRRVIAEVLCGVNVHLSAEELHRRAAARLPEISLATVYNTLSELVALGEVTEVAAVRGGPTRYDPNHFHQHLVCVDCGEILDVHPDNEESLQLTPAESRGYEILDVQITFHGRCAACAGKDRSRYRRTKTQPGQPTA